MTDNSFELTRRKVLASIGGAGAAGAVAGFGTSAYFSDEEVFPDNTLAAGELDLKVDWEEHYSDWSDDENLDIGETDEGESEEDDGQGRFNVRMEQPDDAEAFTAFPPGTEAEFNGETPLIWVPDPYVDDFMANTALEAFPDVDNDGLAEFPVDEITGFGDPCEFLADLGGEDDPGDLATYTTSENDTLGRSDNDDTRLDDDTAAPLINLQDVKPGDFGEVTFSAHLCDNPGYLWMNMPGGIVASENGLSEPEMEDPDEDQTLNEDGEVVPKEGVAEEDTTVELVDELQTAIWYDSNCNNLFDCEEKVDVMAVADTSNSIGGSLTNTDNEEDIDLIARAANTFVAELRDRATDPDQIRAGLLTFNGPSDEGTDISDIDRGFDRPALRAGLGQLSQFYGHDNDPGPDVEEFLPDQGVGDTPIPHALDLAAQVLEAEGRSYARQVILLVTDGLPTYDPPGVFGTTVPYTVEENEGGPLATGGNTFTSDVYDSGGSSASEPVEQDETANLAADLQGGGRTDAETDEDGLTLPGGIEIPVAAIGVSDDEFLRDQVAGDDGDRSMAQDEFFFDVTFDDPAPNGEIFVDDAAVQLAEFIAGGDEECEKTIFQGTLRDAAEELTANDGLGIPLTANQATDFDETAQDVDPTSEARECFSPGVTSCFGFSWWLPVDHANEIQTDSVEFDIGFYTEQCRHNNGSGQTAE